MLTLIELQSLQEAEPLLQSAVMLLKLHAWIDSRILETLNALAMLEANLGKLDIADQDAAEGSQLSLWLTGLAL